MPLARQAAAAAATAATVVALLAATAGAASAPSRAQAQALAQAINLTQTDLRGYQSTAPDRETAAAQRSDDRLAKCDGGVPTKQQIVNLNSRNFQQGAGLTEHEVNSNVTVLPSAALVQKNLRAVSSAKGRRCFQRFINTLVGQTTSGVTVSAGHVSKLPVPVTGTAGAFGMRVALQFSTHGLHVPAVIDVFGIARGPVEIELETLSANGPFPAADEKRLFGALATRAAAKIPG
jgi:hypothetical protein